MVSDVLLDTCCFHPFAQYNFNGCRSDLEFVEDGLAILWLWHPLQGICTEWHNNVLLCLDLLLLDVLCLAIHRIVNVLRLQSEHVAPSKTSETREEECLLDDRVTARRDDYLLQFINGKELLLGILLLWLFLFVEQAERIHGYNTFTDGILHDSAKAIDEDSLSGIAQCLLAIVEGAGLQECDKALNKVLIDLVEWKVLLI